jgi:hypothetical protein
MIGVAGALAAIAVAIPAVSAADRGHGSGHDGDHGGTVGTIESFDETTGALTIAPTTGDPITALVNDRTKIQCRNEDADDDDNGDDHGGSGPGKRSHGGHRGNCDTDALVAGASVEDADLDLSSSGLVFEEVELD